MKRFQCFLLITALLLCLSSCRKSDSTVAEIYHSFMEDIGRSFEGATLYHSEGSLGARVSDSMLTELFSREEFPKEWNKLEEYLLVLSSADNGFELDILKVKHLSEVYEIEQMVNERKKMLCSTEMKKYLGEKYEDYLSSCRIYRKGCYLFFLATGENDRYIRLIDRML